MALTALLKNLADKNRIFCFGTGIYGRACATYLNQRGIEIDGFVVSKAEGYEHVIGKNVYALSEFPVGYQDAFFVVSVAARYRMEIAGNLDGMEIENYFILTDEMIHYMRQHIQYNLENTTNKINVLMYHRVNTLQNYAYQLSIKPHDFEEQLKYLKENFMILSTEEDWIKIDKNAVVLTFDDGYVDFYEYIFPLLRKYEVPATVFVSTAHIEDGDEFFWDILEMVIFKTTSNQIEINNKIYPLASMKERQDTCFRLRNELLDMNFEARRKFLHSLAKNLHVDIKRRDAYRSMRRNELLELAKSPYVVIGGHTVTHSALNTQSSEVQKWEIEESKSYLENLIQREIKVFSYPFGNYDTSAISVVRQCGFKRSFTVKPGLFGASTDSFLIPRNSISGVKEHDFPSFIRERFVLYQ